MSACSESAFASTFLVTSLDDEHTIGVVRQTLTADNHDDTYADEAGSIVSYPCDATAQDASVPGSERPECPVIQFQRWIFPRLAIQPLVAISHEAKIFSMHASELTSTKFSP